MPGQRATVNAKRYVNIGFVIGGLLAWIVFAPFFAWLFGLVSPRLDIALVGQDLRLSNIVGLASAVGLVAFLFVREDLYGGAIEIANELSKVSWPKWDETKVATLVVIVTTLVVAVILGVFDVVWSKLSELIYGTVAQ